jgi:hypothetical protein
MLWCGLDCSNSGEGQIKSSCECGNEPSDAIKCWGTVQCYTARGLSYSAQFHTIFYDKLSYVNEISSKLRPKQEGHCVGSVNQKWGIILSRVCKVTK